jgi:mRNA interferase RelE/StbE
MYKVLWDQKALSDLKLLDVKDARRIVEKVINYLCLNPLELGKPLSKNYKGLYRYRFGDYIIIYEIYKKDVIITIVRIGHKKDVYK